MNSIRIALLAALLCAVGVVNAAVFTVINKGSQTVYANPMWSGRCGCFDALQPGQEMRYDSGFSNVGKIRWIQKLAAGSTVSDPKALVVKIFDADIKLGALNLGGRFEILNDGSYSYMFGIDGSGNGTAKTIEGL